MLFRKITIVGTGLLGGSLALALRARGLAAIVRGYVRREAAVTECERAGLADYATTDLAEAVHDADLVILGTPLAQMRGLAEQFLPMLKPGVLVSDVGSVKASVVAEIEPLVTKAGGHFVGAHPMAGGEQSGVGAARADLFANAVCILTPTATTNAAAQKKIEELWRALGSRLLVMTPQLHDELVARSSHLPHALASALAGYVLRPEHPKEQPQLCASGFRDTTRVASGSPEMWRDIALANRVPLARALSEVIESLQQLQRAVAAGDAAAIEKFHSTAKQRRDAWCGQAAQE